MVETAAAAGEAAAAGTSGLSGLWTGNSSQGFMNRGGDDEDGGGEGGEGDGEEEEEGFRISASSLSRLQLSWAI